MALWFGIKGRSQYLFVALVWLSFISIICAARGRPGVPGRLAIGQNLYLNPGAHLRYQIDLSPAFGQSLANSQEQQGTLAFVVPTGTPVTYLMVKADKTEIPCYWNMDSRSHSLCFATHVPAAIQAIANAKTISFEIQNTNPEGLYLAGWQRADLPGRRLTSPLDMTPPGSSPRRIPVLPAFEIRHFRPDGSLIACGF